MRKLPLLLLLLLPMPFGTATATSSATQDDPPRRALEVDDLFRMPSVGAPSVSPEGDWIAYTVRTTDLEEDSSETRIWMVPTAGGEPLPMTATGASAGSPAWSPDGRWLSFLAARGDGKTQVWGLDRRGGEAQQLTEIEQGVRDYAWSPDGKRLALVIRDPEPEREEWTSEARYPYVIDRLQFKRDYVGYVTGDARDHIYVLDLAGGDLRQVTSGRWDESSPTWSPDGRLIAFVSNRTDEPDGNSNSDIWIVDADNTDGGATLLQVTDNPGSDYAPAWSPDGNHLTYVTVVEPDLIWYATSHLAVVPVEGGEPRLPARALDRNVSSPRYSPDGSGILFNLEDSGARHIARLDLASGTIDRPVDGELSVGSFDVGPGGEIALQLSSPWMPDEIHVRDDDGLHRRTFAHEDWLSNVRLGEVVEIGFASADGTEIEGFVVKPPGFEEGLRYPTLLRIHGGPVSQYDWGFSFEAQMFAAHGYLVVMTNPRGSSGYGQEFSARLWADWGNVDYEDVMAGVDHVIAAGWADPDRLGVGGWSYGGILTDHVITRTDRFKAAITGASEVLYVANYGHDHYQLQWEKELGLPWIPENRERWEAISPFNRVDRITTPTLVMGGEEDWNVPIQNSEQLYQALRRLGVPTQLVVYPGQHHGLAVPAYQKDRYERYLDWYDRWVKGSVSGE